MPLPRSKKIDKISNGRLAFGHRQNSSLLRRRVAKPAEKLFHQITQILVTDVKVSADRVVDVIGLLTPLTVAQRALDGISELLAPASLPPRSAS